MTRRFGNRDDSIVRSLFLFMDSPPYHTYRRLVRPYHITVDPAANPGVLTRFPQAQGVKPHSVPCEESNTTVERRTERGEAINLSPSLAPNENAEEPHKAKKILVDDQVQVVRKE